MTAPAPLDTVRVHGRWTDAAGSPLQGTVSLAPAVPVAAPIADVLIGITGIRKPLDSTGAVEFYVIRSDNPALSGSMPYTVQVDTRGYQAQMTISVLGNTDLADVAPITGPISTDPVYVLAASIGVTVAPLVGGLVPVENLPSNGGGVSDHGALTGLGDDDHPNYLTATRGDARYVQSVNGRTGVVTGLAEASALTGYQPLDTDLTTIASLAPSDGSLLRRVTGAWAGASLTPVDVGLGNVDNTSDLAKPISTATATALAARQPLDSDLTTLATMEPADDALIQRKAGAWTTRTLTQIRTDLGPDVANGLTVGEEVFTRERADSSTISMVSGALRLTYFTARKSEITTQVRVISGTTAAGATPSVCRLGLYLIDGAGDGTLVAAVANDTSLFSVTLTAYTRSWLASYAKVASQRYALGLLVISAAALPTIAGYTMGSALDTETALSPRLTGRINSQTDLPTSFLATSQVTSISRYYGVVLP